MSLHPLCFLLSLSLHTPLSLSHTLHLYLCLSSTPTRLSLSVFLLLEVKLNLSLSGLIKVSTNSISTVMWEAMIAFFVICDIFREREGKKVLPVHTYCLSWDGWQLISGNTNGGNTNTLSTHSGTHSIATVWTLSTAQYYCTILPHNTAAQY